MLESWIFSIFGLNVLKEEIATNKYQPQSFWIATREYKEHKPWHIVIWITLAWWLETIFRWLQISVKPATVTCDPIVLWPALVQAVRPPHPRYFEYTVLVWGQLRCADSHWLLFNPNFLPRGTGQLIWRSPFYLEIVNHIFEAFSRLACFQITWMLLSDVNVPACHLAPFVSLYDIRLRDPDSFLSYTGVGFWWLIDHQSPSLLLGADPLIQKKSTFGDETSPNRIVLQQRGRAVAWFGIR